MNETIIYGRRKRKHVKAEEEEDDSCSDFNRGFVNHCRPRGLLDLIKKLNNQQLEAVENIGFGGLLKMTITSIPSVAFVKTLVQNFNGVSRMLTIDDRNSFVVTNDDICDVFSLPRHGDEVLEMKHSESLKIMSVWKEKYGIDRMCSLSRLKNLIDEKLTEGDDDFKRFFVLYSLSSFLTPTANRMVDFNALKSLIDVEKIREVDWCSYILKQLCRAATKYNNSVEMKNVSGCVLVLPILYFHRLKWRGNAEPTSLPLIQHWSNERMRKRVLEEMSSGALGQGEWVADVYPISLKSSEKSDGPASRSARFIKFELPSNEPSDLDLHSIAVDEVHECFLKLMRDMSVVISSHRQKLMEMKKNKALKTEVNSN